MKKYIVTVAAIVKGLLFDSKKTLTQVIETNNIGKELIDFQNKINRQYSHKIIIENIEYKEIV